MSSPGQVVRRQIKKHSSRRSLIVTLERGVCVCVLVNPQRAHTHVHTMPPLGYCIVMRFTKSDEVISSPFSCLS